MISVYRIQQKTLSAKKSKKIYTNIYLYIIKPYKFAGLPRDCASGRMLVFQEFLQFPFEHGNRGTHPDF